MKVFCGPCTCVIRGWRGLFDPGVANFANTRKDLVIVCGNLLVRHLLRHHTVFIHTKITRSCQELIYNFSSHSWKFSLKPNSFFKLLWKDRSRVNSCSGIVESNSANIWDCNVRIESWVHQDLAWRDGLDFGLYVICYLWKRKYWLKREQYRSGMRPGVKAVKDIQRHLEGKDTMIWFRKVGK